MTKAIEDFFAAWTNPDAAAREALISGAMTDGAVYADPRTETPMTGAAALAEYTGMFASMGMPVAVVNTSTTLSHVRATLQFGAGEQSQMGQYCVDMDDSGKIVRIVGFAGMGEPS